MEWRQTHSVQKIICLYCKRLWWWTGLQWIFNIFSAEFKAQCWKNRLSAETPLVRTELPANTVLVNTVHCSSGCCVKQATTSVLCFTIHRLIHSCVSGLLCLCFIPLSTLHRVFVFSWMWKVCSNSSLKSHELRFIINHLGFSEPLSGLLCLL